MAINVTMSPSHKVLPPWVGVLCCSFVRPRLYLLSKCNLSVIHLRLWVGPPRVAGPKAVCVTHGGV